MPDKGKKDLLKNKCVLPICELLSHENKAVRRETLKTLAFLARESEAKFIIIGEETENKHTKHTKQKVMEVEPNEENYLMLIGQHLDETEDVDLLINATQMIELVS